MYKRVQQLESFLARFKEFSDNYKGERIEQFGYQFQQKLQAYKPLKENLKERVKHEGIRFNIFDILNISFAETRTHTPFLINLLDPDGTHGQGGLFLKRFLRKFVPSAKSEYFLFSDDGYYDVTEEKVFPDGRIDIFIHSLNPKSKWSIMIENKIYAGDQSLQILRYYNYLKKNLGYPKTHIMIYYLTIQGDKPSSYSINENNRDKLIEEKVLKNISYRNDIRQWLDQCYDEVQASNVRELIKQYVNIINNM